MNSLLRTGFHSWLKQEKVIFAIAYVGDSYLELGDDAFQAYYLPSCVFSGGKTGVLETEEKGISKWKSVMVVRFMESSMYL